MVYAPSLEVLSRVSHVPLNEKFAGSKEVELSPVSQEVRAAISTKLQSNFNFFFFPLY